MPLQRYSSQESAKGQTRASRPRKYNVRYTRRQPFLAGRVWTGVIAAMVKALARAFRWRKLLETGVFATVEEIAAAEKINASYVSRVLRLTLLAPNIVEAILDGRQPAEMTLAVLMEPFAVGWAEHKQCFLCQFQSTYAEQNQPPRGRE